MGLTIHYGVRSNTRSDQKAQRLVEKMRQLALDLPFEKVDDAVGHLGPEVCQRPLDDLRGDEALFSTVLDGCKHVPIPWHRKRHSSVTVQPLELFSFWTVPGPGSEWASLGLARYPAEIEMTYRPTDDDKFIKTVKRGCSTRWEFDWRRWERWLNANGHSRYEWPEDEKFQETRKVKTRLGGWRWSSFCKTQYASDPRCGGVANFVRCHLCMIHLLDRIAALPTMKVDLNDEGKYGRSHYSDDWREAHAEGRKPTYTWHQGKYDVKALVEEVGDWNEMIAAKVGALNDMVSGSDTEGCSPIQGFPNFEHLEFRGSQEAHLQPFLQAMAQLAERGRAKA